MTIVRKHRDGQSADCTREASRDMHVFRSHLSFEIGANVLPSGKRHHLTISIVPALFSKSLQLADLSGLGEKAVVDIQLTRDAFFAWV